MANLNPDQFFHGTTASIKDGVVRPVNDVPGKHVSEHSMGDPGDMSEGDHAFAIKNDENYAWHAARTFHAGRPKVYEVEPAADMKPGPHHKDHPDFLHNHDLDDPSDPDLDPKWHDYAKERVADTHQDEYGSKTGFPVKKRIDIMPGRQGTFPQVNWDRFKDGPGLHGADANHPTDETIKYGLAGHKSAHEAALNEHQFSGHDWNKDPAPHSVLREAAGRPQKRWATLLD